jgi:hypothetical protein
LLLLLLLLLQSRFGRGLTFTEFVGVAMTEPRASVRLRDVARLATLAASAAKGPKLAGAAAAAVGGNAGGNVDECDGQTAAAKEEQEA